MDALLRLRKSWTRQDYVIQSIPTEARTAPSRLARNLGPFDTAMIVMGGMIGSGIFMSPYVVAQIAHTPGLILAAWVCGAALALAGAATYAELASQRPVAGGQYASLRDAYHPSLAFLYGWGLLVISQSGGMAAVAITCARYLAESIERPIPERVVAILILAAATLVNCFGVRTWTTVQNALTILKIAMVLAVAGCGALLVYRPLPLHLSGDALPGPNGILALGASLVPVMFAYGGWQTSCYLAGEIKDPQRVLPCALLLGVGSVALLYIALNYVTIRVLGPDVLATTRAPAAAVMHLAAGDWGSRLVSLGVAIAGIGFLNQCMVTVPRVYYAMAADQLFFRAIARLSPQSGMPARAIVLQGTVASILVLMGGYEQLLTWIVAVDFIFYGLAASCIFVFRRRNRKTNDLSPGTTLGHPFTTGIFIAACAFVVVTAILHSPRDSAVGLGLVVSGIPAYLVWKRHRAKLRSCSQASFIN